MKKVAYIFLAIIALWSCSRSEEGAVSDPRSEMLLSPKVCSTEHTRGTIVKNTTDLQAKTFMLYATAHDDVYGDYAVAKSEIGYSDNAWSPTEGHKIYWPTSKSDVTFYAWHPADEVPVEKSGKNLYFECDTKATPTPASGI